MWPDLLSLEDKEAAEIAKTRAEAITMYLKHSGMEMLIPPFYYLTEIVGIEEEVAKSIAEEVEKLLLDEQEEEEEARKEYERRKAAGEFEEEEEEEEPVSAAQ